MSKGSGGTRSSAPRGVTSKQINATVANVKMSEKTSKEIENIYNDIQSIGHPIFGGNIYLGNISHGLVKILKEKAGIEIKGRLLATSTGALTHHQGGEKARRGKEASWNEK